MIVRYSRRALNDLAEILDTLDERSPRGARSVKLAIQHTIDMIGENPGLGHPTGGARFARRQRADIRISYIGRLRRTGFGSCTYDTAHGSRGARTVRERTFIPPKPSRAVRAAGRA
jgi:plasmid stabilization system protein ParE